MSAVRASFYPCLYAEDLIFIFQKAARENFGFQKRECVAQGEEGREGGREGGREEKIEQWNNSEE